MLLSRSTIVFALAVVVLAFPRIAFTAVAQEAEAERHAKRNTVQDAPPPSCHVTLPSAGSAVSRFPDPGTGAYMTVGAYGTETLSTLLPIDGTWRGSMPGKPGDFAYSNKHPWFGAFSYKDGAGGIRVTGKRLDGLAPAFTEIEPITGKHGFMGFMSIPVFGCWEITARYQEQELTFIVWVTPLPQEETAGALLPQATHDASDKNITIDQESPAPATELRRLHVDSDVEAKLLRYRLTPQIPRDARVAHVSGTVVLHAIIDRNGRTRELQYVSGPSLLAQAAIDAALWWEYEVDIEDVEIDTEIEVEFSPGES